jgi:hypothetical protein
MTDRGDRDDRLDPEPLDDFFDDLDRLTEVQILSMIASWRSVDRAGHQRAWAAVRAAGERHGVSDEIDRVRESAIAWTMRGSNLPPYQLNNEPSWTALKLDAREPIVDAALAIALGDRLDRAASDALLAPWNRAHATTE